MLDEPLDRRYDAAQQPRSGRGELELLSTSETRAMLAEVRNRVLERLEHDDLQSADPLRGAGFVYGLVIQHELQHIETMTQTLQLRPAPYPGELGSPARCREAAWAPLPGGAVTIGAHDEPWAYDNELQRHGLELAPYEIATCPVTNGEWAAFASRRAVQRLRTGEPRAACASAGPKSYPSTSPSVTSPTSRLLRIALRRGTSAERGGVGSRSARRRVGRPRLGVGMDEL